MSSASSYALEYLLQFDGYIYVYPNGNYFKIEAKRVKPTPRRPGGIKYSLAFFDERNNCLVRFDNAHGVRIRGRRNPVAFDHWHRFGEAEVVPYRFVDAETLMADFIRAVDARLPPELRSSS